MESPLKRNRSRDRKQKKKGRNFLTIEDWENKKLEEQRRIFEPRNWLDLPSDLMATILMRLSVVDVLCTAQLVCTSWYRICKDPLMWKSIHLNNYNYTFNQQYTTLQKVARIAIDRSCGQLEDISIEYFATTDLLQYITHRSPQLTCLRLARCELSKDKGFSKVVLNLPRLTYIDLSLCSGYKIIRVIEHIGRCCPLLKSFIYNKQLEHRDIGGDIFFEREDNYLDEEADMSWLGYYDEEASVIAANMPGIHHLMLVGRKLTNVGLLAILDGCSHLVSLDLRGCRYINLVGDLGKRCSDQIKELRAPRDSMFDYPYIAYKRRWSISSWDWDYSSDRSYQNRFDDYDDYDNFYDDDDEYLSDKYL